MEKKKMSKIPEVDLEQLKEEHIEYWELVFLLHELMDDIPKNVQDKLHELVYSRYEP